MREVFDSTQHHPLSPPGGSSDFSAEASTKPNEGNVQLTHFSLPLSLKFSSIIALCIFAFASIAAPSPAPSVGFLIPTNEPGHAALRQAAEFAIERRQRLKLPPLRLHVRSGDGQWGSAADDTARLVFEDSATLLISPPSGSITHLILQVSGRTQVPVISLNGDGSVTGAGIPWMLRLVPSTRDQTRRLLPLAKRWTFVVPPDRDGQQITKDLRDAAQSLDPTAFTVLAMNESTEAQIDNALEIRPDGMLLWLSADQAARWSKALRNRGYQGILAGPCWLRSSAFTEAAGSAADGFLVARLQSLASPNTDARTFDRDYRARFGGSPDELAWFAADAIHLAAAWSAAPDPASARDLGIGLTGPWRFAANGDRLEPLVIHQFHNGRWSPPQDNSLSAPLGEIKP